MSETKMLRLPNGSMPKNEGEFAWDETEAYCRMMLPGKHFTNIPTDRATAASKRWQWNGNVDRPTLSPSVLVYLPREDGTREELWHGFITDGVMRSC